MTNLGTGPAHLDFQQPITFITGYPRSGTTLLANQLNQLQDVCVGPETQYYCKAFKQLKTARSGRQFMQVLSGDNRLQDFGLDPSELVDAARDSGFDRNRLLSAFLRRHAALQGVEAPAILVEKSPAHILHTRKILECHPLATFIYLVKDPRDVVSSNLRMDWTHSNVPKHCAAWNMYNDAFMRLHRQYPDRVHLLRFEDLVTALRLQIRQICQFLDIPYSPVEGKAASAVPDWESAWKATSAGEIDPGKAYSWQRDNCQKQHQLVSAMTRKYRAIFRYDREPEGSKLRFLPRAWAYNSPAYRSILRFRRVYL
ncbi:sulfotransferase family protein [Haliea sp. E17]|uniref:sulfotransferase family protein n=1 Tax=Haliea sp. E17 TaxID=3401576 RepID=UPI003AAF5A56